MPDNPLDNIVNNTNRIGQTMRDIAAALTNCVKAGIQILIWLIAAFAALSAAFVAVRLIIFAAKRVLHIAGLS